MNWLVADDGLMSVNMGFSEEYPILMENLHTSGSSVNVKQVYVRGFALNRTGKIDSDVSPFPPLNLTVCQKCKIWPRFSATRKKAGIYCSTVYNSAY